MERLSDNSSLVKSESLDTTETLVLLESITQIHSSEIKKTIVRNKRNNNNKKRWEVIEMIEDRRV